MFLLLFDIYKIFFDFSKLMKFSTVFSIILNRFVSPIKSQIAR